MTLLDGLQDIRAHTVPVDVTIHYSREAFRVIQLSVQHHGGEDRLGTSNAKRSD